MDSVIDKNIIDYTTYHMLTTTGEECLLVSYTAKWCGPCKKIKPVVIELMNKNNYSIWNSTTMEKSKFKTDVNDFIPFFQIVTHEIITCPCGTDCGDSEVINTVLDSIQTSNPDEFIDFLIKNNIKLELVDKKLKLDDNF
jgi:thiol-disulfide isomerase/thioredoxin